LPAIEQYQSFELSKDLNPLIVKGMMGIILEILEPEKTFEVEFPQEDGSNFIYEGKASFTISSDYILEESPAV
jgi:hypothetical protein